MSDFCLGFFKHSEQSVFRTAPALKCVLNNKVSTSLTLSRTEGIAVERIQHLNTEFWTEVKKERYRLNLSLSSRLRASNQNLYEVFQIRPVKQTLLFGIKKQEWCYIVEDACKAGAFQCPMQYSIILAALFTTKSFASIWRIRQTNTNLQFIVYLMFSVDAVLHGFLNPFNCSFGIPVSDIGPGLIIASI